MSNPQPLSPIPPPPAPYKLEAKQGPLVWIDCEMTGLDIERGDRLLEVACIVTDGDLNPVDEGVSYVISQDKEVMENMNAWCINQHELSGLTSACLSPTLSFPHASVRAAILAYVRDRVPIPNSACLAGNTVHADKVFLLKEMPELITHLHYRIVDVSSIKELVRRWYTHSNEKVWKGKKTDNGGEKEADHRALADIKSSIEELRWYKTHVFQQPQPQPNPSTSI